MFVEIAPPRPAEKHFFSLFFFLLTRRSVSSFHNMANFTVENVFGIGSFRLCAGFPSSIKSAESTGDYVYEFPLNGCLVVQNYSRDERLHFEHVYDDIIVVMLYNLYTNQVLTCSYSGKIILWSHNYQRRFVEQQVRIDHVFYGHWTRDGTTIYLCSRFDGEFFP